MTVLAGVFSPRPNTSLPDTLCRSLLSSLTRDPADEVLSFRDTRCLLAKVDIGAYGARGWEQSPGGSVSILAGEPLLRSDERGPVPSRAEDLRLLHRAWDRDDWSPLTRARGVFCAAHYAPVPGRLSVVSDKLGVRPLYYSILGEQYVVFASALRILEALAEVPKDMDVRAVTEIATLGYALGEGTPYLGIRALRAGQVVHFTQAGRQQSSYWHWDAIPTSHLPESELLKEAYRRFTAGVDQRLRGDASTLAFLSGGLDSRCVVAALRRRSVRTHTFTLVFARDIQDPAFAAAFAHRPSNIHHAVPADNASQLPIALRMSQYLRREKERLALPSTRPNLIWAGEGGSVSVGHVYMSRELVSHMRALQHEAAAVAFLQHQGAHVVRRLLQPRQADAVSRFPVAGILAELEQLQSAEPGRRFHLFLMLNDQRRHLAGHFEEIDRHRLEFHLPFFDSDLLELIMSAPVETCLGHQFYTKWLSHFPAVVTAVPWQSYPGHVPCPIPIPTDLRSQWDRKTCERASQERRARVLQRGRDLLRASPFPHHLLRRHRLRLAYWLTRAGLTDYSYAITFADAYCSAWSRTVKSGEPLHDDLPPRW